MRLRLFLGLCLGLLFLLSVPSWADNVAVMGCPQ
jgi:hypothetical protein